MTRAGDLSLKDETSHHSSDEFNFRLTTILLEEGLLSDLSPSEGTRGREFGASRDLDYFGWCLIIYCLLSVGLHVAGEHV